MINCVKTLYFPVFFCVRRSNNYRHFFCENFVNHKIENRSLLWKIKQKSDRFVAFAVFVFGPVNILQFDGIQWVERRTQPANIMRENAEFSTEHLFTDCNLNCYENYICSEYWFNFRGFFCLLVFSRQFSSFDNF